MNTNSEYFIVYEIINAIRNNEYNNDEVLTERLVRQHLKTYRADILRKYYKNGINVDDEVLQKLDVELKQDYSGTFSFKIPKIIRLDKSFGFFLNKDSYNIPILDSESFDLSRKTPFGQRSIKAKTENEKIIIGFPDKKKCLIPSGEFSSVLKLLEKEARILKKIKLQFTAVLADPSDDPNYNWEESIYPFPSEKLPELKSTIAFKEYGMTVQFRKDEIQNARADTINENNTNE